MEIKNCLLCPRQCGVFRSAGEGSGYCGMGANAVLARAALHFWEEPCISGTRGSGAVFFTGCSLKCVYCQNYEISTERNVGKSLTPQELAGTFQRLADQGAHNINLVNPTHFAAAVIEALRIWKPAAKIPVVYNTSGYERVETVRALRGLVDIYLPDFKYAESQMSLAYSGAEDYALVAKAALLEMAEQTGKPVFGSDGMLRSGTMVRHLILPGHTRNSIAVLRLIRENFPGIPVSLMAQYTPIKGRLLDASCVIGAELPELFRPITARELRKVQEELFSLGLDGFVQSRSAKGTEYVPDFHQFEA